MQKLTEKKFTAVVVDAIGALVLTGVVDPIGCVVDGIVVVVCEAHFKQYCGL